MPTKRRKFGDLGENIAEQYLIKNGYLILERNFRVKLGELDIIALKINNPAPFLKMRKKCGINKENKQWNREIIRKGEIIRKLLKGDADLIFVEVKSGKLNLGDVSRETSFLPEEHVDSRKKRLLIRSAQIYLAYKKLPLDINWQIDVIAVEIDKYNRKANLRHIEKAVTL